MMSVLESLAIASGLALSLLALSSQLAKVVIYLFERSKGKKSYTVQSKLVVAPSPEEIRTYGEKAWALTTIDDRLAAKFQRHNRQELQRQLVHLRISRREEMRLLTLAIYFFSASLIIALRFLYVALS